MEIVQEITHRAGAGGFGKKDDSDDLSEMTYAEKLVFTQEFLDALETLKVQEKSRDIITGGSIMLSQADILPLRDDVKEIGMNGICHKLNQVFVAGKMPFYATSYSTDNAEKKTVTKTRGEHKGDSYKITVSDRVRVYRISKEWDIDNYAVLGSKNLKNTAYHTATIGMILRTQKNLEDWEVNF